MKITEGYHGNGPAEMIYLPIQYRKWAPKEHELRVLCRRNRHITDSGTFPTRTTTQPPDFGITVKTQDDPRSLRWKCSNSSCQ